MAFNDGWEIVFGVALCFTIVHVVGSLALFVWRRHTHPISGHHVPLVFLCVVSVALNGVVISVAYSGFDINCWWWLIFVLNGATVCAIAYIARAARIYVHYQKQALKLRATRSGEFRPLTAAAAGKLDSDSDSGESVKRSKFDNPQNVEKLLDYLTDRKLAMASVVVSIAAMAAQNIPYILATTNETFSTRGDDQTCDQLRNSRIVFVTFNGLAIAIAAVTIFVLRRISDGYSIRTELARCIVWATGSVTIYCLPLDLYLHDLSQFVCLIIVNMLTFHTVTWKLYESYDLQRKTKATPHTLSTVSHTRRESSLNSALHLRQVLDSPGARAKFENHLKLEWSVENLLFYMAVRNFGKFCSGKESSPSDEEKNARAFVIYNTYIIDDAPSQVNLPEDINKVIRGKIKTRESEPVADDLYKDAAEEIYGLMKRDSFMRFSVKYSYEDVFSDVELSTV